MVDTLQRDWRQQLETVGAGRREEGPAASQKTNVSDARLAGPIGRCLPSVSITPRSWRVPNKHAGAVPTQTRLQAVGPEPSPESRPRPPAAPSYHPVANGSPGRSNESTTPECPVQLIDYGRFCPRSCPESITTGIRKGITEKGQKGITENKT